MALNPSPASTIGKLSISLTPTSMIDPDADGFLASLAAVNSALATVQAALAGKADSSALGAKADASAMTTALAAKAVKAEVDAAIATLTSGLGGKADQAGTTAALASMSSTLNTKADGAATTAALNTKADAAAMTSALATITAAITALQEGGGGGGGDYSEAIATLNTAVAGKAAAADLATLATTVAGKAAAADLATLTTTVAGKADGAATTTALAGKADAAATTTALGLKADASALAAKADASAMTTALGLKADASALAAKADASAMTTALGLKADASALAAKADAAATTTALGLKANASDMTTALGTKLGVGSVYANLMSETAAARGGFPGASTIYGADAAGAFVPYPVVLTTEAAPTDLISGGVGIMTAASYFAMNSIREIFVIDGVLTCELAKPETGKENYPLNFRAEATANVFLRMMSLPDALLGDAEVRGTVSIRNSHTAAITVNLAKPLVGTVAGTVTRQAFDTTVARSGWESGSFANRTIPAGQQRVFEFRVRRGRVHWTALPISKINMPELMDQHTRDTLRSVNLPVLTGLDWYSMIIVTVTNLDSAAAPAVTDGSLITTDNAPNGIEQIDTIANATHCAGRIEGLIFRGGNIIFDNSTITGQNRAIFVQRHNYRPVSVASLFFTHTWRAKATASLTQLWAGATIPGGEACHLVVMQFARGGAAVPIVPRTELAPTSVPTAWRGNTAGHMRLFYTPTPVTAWAEASTDGVINSEGLGLVIPLISAT